MITRQHLTDRRLYWKQTPWRLRIAWQTARGEYHRLRGDYWRALVDARRGQVEPLTIGEQRQLAGLRAKVGVPDNVMASPHQTAEVLRRAPLPLAARVIAQWQQHSTEARMCWEQNHQGELDRYRQQERDRVLAGARSRG